MSDDERGLLAYIAASPADDTPRLVYADWLDDHGRPVRAEFIRLQCRIAQIETQPRHVVNMFSGLWRRQQEILDGHQAELMPEDIRLDSNVRVVFERGFAAEVTLAVQQFRSNSGHLERMLPRPRVTVEGGVGQIRQFIGFDNDIDIANEDDEPLKSHLVTAVRPLPIDAHYELALVDGQDPIDVQQWPNLDTLDIEGCQLGSIGLHVLCEFTDFPRLEYLDLAGNSISDAGVIVLLESSLPRQLRRLVLGGNPIRDQGAIELADRWPRTSPLESLNLRFTNIGTPGQRALLARFGGVVDLF